MSFEWRATIENDIAEWDEVEFDPALLLKHFKRILKPKGNIFAFTNYNLIGRWHEIFDPEYNTFQMFYWHKTNPVPNIRKSSFLKSVESAICCWDKGHQINFIGQNKMHNFVETPICMGKERIKYWSEKEQKNKTLHRTQKPIKVLEYIVERFSNENDIILDCFSGVASTGVSALKHKRRFLGFENIPKYYFAGKKRLKIVSS